jgi:methylated-DNA-[protein]-cysteine S-methyltransferase
MKLTTVPTPDGTFTILVDSATRQGRPGVGQHLGVPSSGRVFGEVLASGWTDSPDAILARLPAGVRPGEVQTVAADDPAVAFATGAVRAFYAGELTAIDAVPVRQYGTAFRLAGWMRLRAIPAGAPLSYAEFAAALGRPSAVRAAASVCATNAPALFVPCHRVLRGDGTLGGFAWGVDVKRSLLAREAEAAALR